jgi:hypothetical protein
LMRHDWGYRWEAVLKTVGLEPMPGVLRRKERLRNLSRAVVQNDDAPAGADGDAVKLL